MTAHHEHTVERVLNAVRRSGRRGATAVRVTRDANTGKTRAIDILAALEAAGFVTYHDTRRWTGNAPRLGDDRRLADLIAGYKAATSRPGRPEARPAPWHPPEDIPV